MTQGCYKQKQLLGLSTNYRINYGKWHINWVVGHSNNRKQKLVAFMVGTNLKPFIPILISRLKKLESCFLVFSLDITLTSFKFPTIIITVQTINKLKHDKSILTLVRFIFLYLVYRAVQTKAPYFVFHPKVVLYNFFSIFFKWCRQQAWEIL